MATSVQEKGKCLFFGCIVIPSLEGLGLQLSVLCPLVAVQSDLIDQVQVNVYDLGLIVQQLEKAVEWEVELLCLGVETVMPAVLTAQRQTSSPVSTWSA